MAGFLSYEAINTAVNDVIASADVKIAAVSAGAKSLAVAFMLVNWIKEFIERKADGENEGKLPVTVKSILLGIFYIFIVISWTPITQTLNGLLDSYVNSFEFTEGSNSMTIFAEFEKRFETEKSKEEQEEASILSQLSLATIASVLLKIWDFFNGAFMSFILYFIKGIAWIINLIAYPIFLLERAFLLFALNILAPFVIALAALDKFRELIYRWVKVYCAVFLTGLLFLVVNWFCEAIFQKLYDNFTATAEGGIFDAFSYYDRHIVEVCIFTVIAFAKLKLYGTSITLANRIFS